MIRSPRRDSESLRVRWRREGAVVHRAAIATTGVMWFALLCALSTAPSAIATPDRYLEEVRARVDVALADAQALELGNIACQALRDGVESGLTFGEARHQADQAVGWASYERGLGLTQADGMFLVEAAEDQLC